jgi:glycosyltransferase involved in cell wall biosynthesis
MYPTPKYSIVVPVYNRPDEIGELLESLTHQTYSDFEVIVVEDGSSVPCDGVVDRFRDKLTLQYIYKLNSGPGSSRNAGFEQAKGEYFVVFDSDCIVPSHYLDAVNRFFHKQDFDAWGGPDRGHERFSPLQQAMGFTMSSTLTTGGIRGGKKQAGLFQPRSFNMGISRKVFEATGGFQFGRVAEDIELSIRMRKAGFRVVLIHDAYVYHKRRTSLSAFFRQVANFGRGRVRVGLAHPGEVRITHWFPSLFLIGLLALPILMIIDRALLLVGIAAYACYLLAVSIAALIKTRSPLVAMLTSAAAFVQLVGYGYGFLQEWAKSYINPSAKKR